MSAAVEVYRDDLDASYAVDFGRDREPTQKRSRFPEYRRQGNPPSRVSGMHCRRQKRWTWGSGRGARMLNARAFAGSLAFAVASLAATAFGVVIDYRTVGNPGNANNPVNSLGAVSSAYRIGTYEVTNTQYAEFLNAVGRSNTNSIYNANQGTNANGGITQSGSSGSFTYAVKSGFANRPVNFVSWYSAARFINWLQNGQTTNVSSMESGAYTIPSNATTGSVIARSAAATVFLPTVNQQQKAAYYNPATTAYFAYGTSSNTAPTGGSGSSTAITNFTIANSANYNSSGTTAVGAFTNASFSPYGAFDLTGNVGEFSETANPTLATQVYSVGGAFNSATGSPALTGASFIAMNGSAAIGFRVAAVPEPSTLGLAGVGFLALVGLQVMKHRRRKMSA
ncbi:MAG: PEP-CTERM sorting domain-containing protein [Planctomycetota bacterium]|nr:MAG: PEP-CTERM sorting domain-containing protein [Planctomycetota bacterium]